MSNYKLTNESREKIEEQALKVLEAAHIRVGEPPIDLMRVASSVGVAVYSARFSDSHVSGIVTTNPANNPVQVEPGRVATVFINSEKPITHQHFTIAHEIGHVQLGHHGDGILLRAVGHPYNPQQEREANAFAAGLLMPAEPFISALYRQANIAKVALSFGVSLEAATIRANTLQNQLELEYEGLQDLQL